MRALIIGARKGSLGYEIADRAMHSGEFVTTGGLTDEDRIVDVTSRSSIRAAIEYINPHTIVVTAGINVGAPVGSVEYSERLSESLSINTTGVLSVLNEWVQHLRDITIEGTLQFVAISSNSADIARSNSTAYCASKAALSMGLRVAARELKGRPLVYGYEFGLLRGTPMTQSTEKRFGPHQTRIPGFPQGLAVGDAADQIWAQVMLPWPGLNGTLHRLDGGEQ